MIAGCYAVWHGPEGLKRIARRVNLQARMLADAARQAGHRVLHDAFFDTIAIETPNADTLIQTALTQGFNLRRISDMQVGIALDETVTREELTSLAAVLGGTLSSAAPSVPAELARNTRSSNRQCSTSIIPSTRCCATSSALRRRTSRSTAA